MMKMKDADAGERAATASTSTISLSAASASASNSAATPATTTTAGRGNRGSGGCHDTLPVSLLPNEDEMPAECPPIQVPDDEDEEIESMSMSRSRRHKSDNVDVVVVQDPLSTVTPPAVEVETKEIRRPSTRVSFAHLDDNKEDIDLGLPQTCATDGCDDGELLSCHNTLLHFFVSHY